MNQVPTTTNASQSYTGTVTPSAYDLRDHAAIVASQAKGIFMPAEHALAPLTHPIVSPSLSAALAAVQDLNTILVRCAVSVEPSLTRIWCAPRDRLKVVQALERREHL